MHSMTGYGRGYAEGKQMAVELDIKSVNNRYLDIQARLPQSILYTESVIKNRIKEEVQRGRVDLFVRTTTLESGPDAISIDMGLAKSVYEKLEALREALGFKDPVTMETVILQDGVIVKGKNTYDEEEIKNLCLEALNQALEAFISMRSYEGQKLAEDMEAQLEKMRTELEVVKIQAPQLVKAYENRLRLRMLEILEDTEIAEDRILTEVAIYAEKSDINEEIVRLSAHIDHFQEAMQARGPLGKQLDFLCQEMNREVNTMSSKSNDSLLTESTLRLKYCVEQIREQVQNVE